MKCRVQLPMGSNPIQIEGEVADLKGLIQALSAFEGMPAACPYCKGTNLWPSFRTPKGFTYFSIRCQGCDAEYKFGQAKEGGRLFPKGWDRGHATNGGSIDGARDARGKIPPPSEADYVPESGEQDEAF